MFFAFCALCGLGTLWVFLRRATDRGRATHYDIYECSRCEKMHALRPRDK